MVGKARSDGTCSDGDSSRRERSDESRLGSIEENQN